MDYYELILVYNKSTAASELTLTTSKQPDGKIDTGSPIPIAWIKPTDEIPHNSSEAVKVAFNWAKLAFEKAKVEEKKENIRVARNALFATESASADSLDLSRTPWVFTASATDRSKLCATVPNSISTENRTDSGLSVNGYSGSAALATSRTLAVRNSIAPGTRAFSANTEAMAL